MSATAVIADLVVGVIDKLKGAEKLTASGVAAAVAEKVQEALVVVIAVELQKVAAQLGVALATYDVAETAQRVLAAWNAAGPGLVARTLDGIEMVEMPQSWHPDPDPKS